MADRTLPSPGDTGCVAHAAVTIRAPRGDVFRALLAPETIPRILPVERVLAPFRLGAPFAWTFDLGGRPSHVEGHVLEVVDGVRLVYTYGDPHARDVRGVDLLHQVTIELEGDDDLETRVSVQDANHAPEAWAHAEGGWRLALRNLQHLVESGARAEGEAGTRRATSTP